MSGSLVARSLAVHLLVGLSASILLGNVDDRSNGADVVGIVVPALLIAGVAMGVAASYEINRWLIAISTVLVAAVASAAIAVGIGDPVWVPVMLASLGAALSFAFFISVWLSVIIMFGLVGSFVVFFVLGLLAFATDRLIGFGYLGPIGQQFLVSAPAMAATGLVMGALAARGWRSPGLLGPVVIAAVLLSGLSVWAWGTVLEPAPSDSAISRFVVSAGVAAIIVTWLERGLFRGRETMP